MILVVQDITRLLDILVKNTYFTCHEYLFNIIYGAQLGIVLELSSSPTPIIFFFLFMSFKKSNVKIKSKLKNRKTTTIVVTKMHENTKKKVTSADI